jgi:ribose 5-phosphate isomerase B
MVYLGADHAGFELKEALRSHLEERGEDVSDLGPKKLVPGDDYPGYAFAVARAVAANPGSRGILVCDTGVGDAIAANKVSGIRAALVHDAFTAKRAREHNDANVLSLGAESVSDRQAKELVDIFLDTPFSGAERHKRRLAEIAEAEA